MEQDRLNKMKIQITLLIIVTMAIPLVAALADIPLYGIGGITVFISCYFLHTRITSFFSVVGYLCCLLTVFARFFEKFSLQSQDIDWRGFLREGICLTIEFFAIYMVALTFIKYINRLKKEKNDLSTNYQQLVKEIENSSDFLAQMSHEVRNPINAVLSINEMLLQETDEPQTENYALKIRTAGRYLLNLVNNVLDYSRIEAGKMEIIKKEYDIALALKETIELYSVQAETKGLEFAYEIPEDMPRYLVGDQFRITQAVSNLLSNAIKYTEKGAVRLQLDFETINEEKGKLLIAVADTGIGIKPEEIEQLFGSYNRLDIEKNRTIQGSGLGLKICKQTIELMGGTMKVESEYGKGSVFAFGLEQYIAGTQKVGDFRKTLEVLNEKEERKVSNPLGRISGAKVLIVDDNDINLQVAESILKRTDCIVECVSSGMECLERVYKQAYDLILLDHMMPEIDGVQVLRQLKGNKDHLCQQAVVVVLTANAISGAKNQYLEMGFDDYIAKPMELKELDRILAEHMPDLYEAPETSGDYVENTQHVVWDLFSYHIDTAKGLEYLGNDKEQYLSTAEIFVKDYEKRVQKLGQAMEDENLEDYAVLVHGLKGNARTLGAEILGELAFEEEKAAKSGDLLFIEEHQYKMSKEWQLVVEGFCSILGNQDVVFGMEEAPELVGRDLEDQILTAMACIEGGQYAEAFELLQGILQHKVDTEIRGYVQQGFKLLEEDNPQEAIACLNKAWKGV